MTQSRVKEREQVFALLFSAEFQKGESAETLLSASAESNEMEVSDFSDYVKDTLVGAMAFSDEAMELVTSAAHGWTAARMTPTMRALFKLSLYEILKTEIAVNIAINEAVELCKHYEDEKGAKFLNGVLGSIARDKVPEKCKTE